MTESPDLHLQWSDQDASSYVNDLAGSAEQVAADANEPADTLALAVTAAIASEGLGDALDHEWAIYTSQDAAVAASAIHATLQASIENLRRLERAVRHVGARGDATIPAPSGMVAPEDENLADALDRLTGTADELETHLDLLPPAIRTLQDAPAGYQPPQDVHDTLMAVAALLGDQSQLITKLEDCHAGEEDKDDPCGCVIEISGGGERYFFDYSDSGWMLLRHSAAATSKDGGQVWTNAPRLDVKGGLAHPHQLAQEIRLAMEVRSDA